MGNEMEEKSRCAWAESQSDQYVRYHDEEWGVPVHDDMVHFEFLILEGAQAGLSWAAILKRREGYREAFAGFDPQIVAGFSEEKIQNLLKFEGIIRNRLKVRSAVTNAQKFLEVQDEFGSFNAYIWQFTAGKPLINHWKDSKNVPASTKESEEMSKDLKKRGFKFVGSTIMYAYMQACGMVNDHTTDCFRHQEVNRILR